MIKKIIKLFLTIVISSIGILGVEAFDDYVGVIRNPENQAEGLVYIDDEIKYTIDTILSYQGHNLSVNGCSYIEENDVLYCGYYYSGYFVIRKYDITGAFINIYQGTIGAGHVQSRRTNSQVYMCSSGTFECRIIDLLDDNVIEKNDFRDNGLIYTCYLSGFFGDELICHDGTNKIYAYNLQDNIVSRNIPASYDFKSIYYSTYSYNVSNGIFWALTTDNKIYNYNFSTETETYYGNTNLEFRGKCFNDNNNNLFCQNLVNLSELTEYSIGKVLLGNGETEEIINIMPFEEFNYEFIFKVGVDVPGEEQEYYVGQSRERKIQPCTIPDSTGTTYTGKRIETNIGGFSNTCYFPTSILGSVIEDTLDGSCKKREDIMIALARDDEAFSNYNVVQRNADAKPLIYAMLCGEENAEDSNKNNFYTPNRRKNGKDLVQVYYTGDVEKPIVVFPNDDNKKIPQIHKILMDNLIVGYATFYNELTLFKDQYVQPLKSFFGEVALSMEDLSNFGDIIEFNGIDTTGNDYISGKDLMPDNDGCEGLDCISNFFKGITGITSEVGEIKDGVGGLVQNYTDLSNETGYKKFGEDWESREPTGQLEIAMINGLNKIGKVEEIGGKKNLIKQQTEGTFNFIKRGVILFILVLSLILFIKKE